MNYDLLIFRAINNLATHNIVVDDLGIFLAEYLAYCLIIFLVIFFFWRMKDRAKNIIMLSVAFISGLIARFVVKSLILIFYDRYRPYASLASVHKLISTSASEAWQSFPSGHAIFFFALSTALCFYNRKLGYWFLTASILMGLARIFVGVHWPSDILAGAILGILTAFLVQKIYLSFEKYIKPFLLKFFQFSL